MAEKKNTDIHTDIPGFDTTARKEEIKAAQAAFPATPEHFRDTVRRAVQMQLSGQDTAAQTVRFHGQAEHFLGKDTPAQAEHFRDQDTMARAEHFRRQDTMAQSERLHDQASASQANVHTSLNPGRRRKQAAKNRRRWRRYLLPATAILAIGGAAMAAGSGWLKEQLMGRGFSREEADVLLTTEPAQTITEMDASAFPEGAVKEKDWRDSLLTVSEAYFDGAALHFLAEPSREALDYDLYLKDHAAINGHDSLTILQPLEGDNLYLGRIELADKQYVDEILSADSVSVTMRIVAAPKYDGNLLFTWKDSKAYEKLFDTGSFTDENGFLYYIVSAREAYTGYTPHELTMEIPLSDGAKEVIGAYLKKGDTLTDSALTDDSLSDGSSASDHASTDGSDSVADNGDISASQNVSSETDQTGYTDPQITVDGSHAVCEFPSTSGSLLVDAQFVQDADIVYTGALTAEEVSADALKSLYPDGEPQLWLKNHEDEDNSWQYQEQPIFASCFMHYVHYQNDTLSDSSAAAVDKQQEIRLCKEALGKIGLDCTVTEDDYFSFDHTNYYTGQAVLEGLPVAYSSQWNSQITLCVENGQLAYLNAPAPLTVVSKEEADLMDVSEMLEHVASYVSSGDITLPESGQPVTKITLEYYADLTGQGIIFRPIWNFKVPYIYEESEALAGRENFFYIDAITGALIRTAWGW